MKKELDSDMTEEEKEMCKDFSARASKIFSACDALMHTEPPPEALLATFVRVSEVMLVLISEMGYTKSYANECAKVVDEKIVSLIGTVGSTVH